MVVTVVCFNLLIAIACLFVARQIWQFRRKLARIDLIFIRLEHRANMLLCRTRNFVVRGKSSSSRLKEQYNSLQDKLQKLEKMIAIIRLTQLILGQRRYRTRKN